MEKACARADKKEATTETRAITPSLLHCSGTIGTYTLIWRGETSVTTGNFRVSPEKRRNQHLYYNRINDFFLLLFIHFFNPITLPDNTYTSYAVNPVSI